MQGFCVLCMQISLTPASFSAYAPYKKLEPRRRSAFPVAPEVVVVPLGAGSSNSRELAGEEAKKCRRDIDLYDTMATMQKLPDDNTSTWGSYSLCQVDVAVSSELFPVGLRVLAVDDDVTCLKIIEQKLQKCWYHVTTCSEALTTLSLLRERKSGFDVIISDVHMPDMDGFKLLELVGLEMDLPVIMMSGHGRTSAVMRGIKHGACDYLIKPIRIEELKNIWQHVLRKKWNESKDVEHSRSFEDFDRQKRLVNEGIYDLWKTQKKKRDSKDDEDNGKLKNKNPSVSKKARVDWSLKLHQQFVNAVNQLGIDKAVPKRIMELMNVPGLTRGNVASHLQWRQSSLDGPCICEKLLLLCVTTGEDW